MLRDIAQGPVADLFDVQLRAKRRDRSARIGPELFLLQRAFDDCLERVTETGRSFDRALLIGCPDPAWRERLGLIVEQVSVGDPGPLFASAAGGQTIVEDRWEPVPESHDLVLAIGTLDAVNDLPLALRLVRSALRPRSLFLGAFSGGETLPQLRNAMRSADLTQGVASPHVHPRIEPSAVAPLLSQAGFQTCVVDVDRVPVAYRSLDRLVADLRAMGATNVLSARPRMISRAAYAAASKAFAHASEGERTIETFEILHFAAWT